MLPVVLLVGASAQPEQSPSSGTTTVLVAAAIVAIAALCLFLLFRRGSIADRAKVDVPDPDDVPDH